MTPGSLPHAAVLLAAGGSARLGQPKQLLTIDGVPLVRHVASLLAATMPRDLGVIVNDPGIGRHLAGLGATVLHNPDWREGLSTSVRLAARKFGAGPVLFASVDQCRLEAAHLRALLAVDEGRDVVTRYGPEAFGIPALVQSRSLAEAAGLVGDRGFGPIWRRARVPPVFVDAAHLGFDLDTPADLALAVRRGWIDGLSRRGHRGMARAARQERLLAVAREMLVAYGDADTTMAMIAQASGLSRRTLYRCFPNKQALLAACQHHERVILAHEKTD